MQKLKFYGKGGKFMTKMDALMKTRKREKEVNLNVKVQTLFKKLEVLPKRCELLM